MNENELRKYCYEYWMALNSKSNKCIYCSIGAHLSWYAQKQERKEKEKFENLKNALKQALKEIDEEK